MASVRRRDGLRRAEGKRGCSRHSRHEARSAKSGWPNYLKRRWTDKAARAGVQAVQPSMFDESPHSPQLPVPGSWSANWDPQERSGSSVEADAGGGGQNIWRLGPGAGGDDQKIVVRHARPGVKANVTRPMRWGGGEVVRLTTTSSLNRTLACWLLTLDDSAAGEEEQETEREKKRLPRQSSTEGTNGPNNDSQVYDRDNKRSRGQQQRRLVVSWSRKEILTAGQPKEGEKRIRGEMGRRESTLRCENWPVQSYSREMVRSTQYIERGGLAVALLTELQTHLRRWIRQQAG